MKRSQKSKVKSQKSKIQLFNFSTLRLPFLLRLFFCLSLATSHSPLLFGQQPQAQQGQPLHAVDAKYVNGLAPGYWPSAGTGLTLKLSTGTALCGNPPAPVAYTGGTLTMAAGSTNYVYLDPLGSCVPASNTSGFNVGQIRIAVVVTNASTITAVNDVRSFFSPPTTLDSAGGSIFKGLNGAYFADQFGNKRTTGIASAIAACGTSTPCQVVVPGSYPATEQVPGSQIGGGSFNRGTTSSNVQVLDFRSGDVQTAINARGNGSAGAWHQWVDNVYNPYSTSVQARTVFSLVMNNLDGGFCLDNGGVVPPYYKKSGAEAIWAIVNNYTPGDPGNRFITNQYSVGDSFPVYAIDNFYGGWATQGEEGAEGVDIWVLQGNAAYQGTITSGGLAGAMSLTFNPTAGAGTQGAGRYLIDVTKAYSTGTITAINGPGRTPVTFTGSGTSWPVSTVNTTTTAAIAAPGSRTVTVASTSGITTSTVLVICDGSAYETVIPSAVGSGSCPGASCTITATFAAPHSTGAIVASGGLSGYFLELTADTVPAATTKGTALRQAFPVLYSSSSTSLAASIVGQGFWQPLTSTIGTACIPSSGCAYVLYPGAQVTSVQSAGGIAANVFTLMPNSVNWANGDAVELPQHPASHSSTGSWLNRSWWPGGNPNGPHVMFYGVPGAGTTGMWIQNLAPTTLYRGNGGNLYPPYNAVSVWGPWTSLVEGYGYGPSVYGLTFDGQTWGSTGVVYPVSVRPASGGSDYLEYDEGKKNWTLTVNSVGGAYNLGDNVSVATGGFITPGHIGSKSSDVQGTVAVSSNTSATVGFSVAFQHAPICTLTPTSDPASVGAYWVTSTTAGVTANVHTSGTITFNYTCMANPN